MYKEVELLPEEENLELAENISGYNNFQKDNEIVTMMFYKVDFSFCPFLNLLFRIPWRIKKIL